MDHEMPGKVALVAVRGRTLGALVLLREALMELHVLHEVLLVLEGLTAHLAREQRHRFPPMCPTHVLLKRCLSPTTHNLIDLNLSINLNNNKLNHKHCHVSYCKQLLCGEILTVIYCYNKQIIGVMASNGSIQQGYKLSGTW